MTTDVRVQNGLFATLRRDAWWLEDFFYIFVFGGFIAYTVWAGLHPYAADGRACYEFGPYLSPFFSPFFNPDWMKSLPVLIQTPALFILWAPAGFRGTCYYYRKAYYRSMFMDPPGCAVGEACKQYHGEKRFLLFQNLHRYFLYLALIFVVILSWDAILAFLWPANGIGPDNHSAAGPKVFGAGVGTLVLIVNAVLIAGYTLGCHALRHLVGGGLDFFRVKKNNPVRFGLWKFMTRLNEHHMFWALSSMIWVGLADLYIRLCATGVIHDLRFF